VFKNISNLPGIFCQNADKQLAPTPVPSPKWGRGEGRGLETMSEHNELGKQGEEIATTYLLKQGYLILDVNWRAGRNEIDIIAQDKDFLVIIEVKARRSDTFMEPEEAVTRDKQQSLIRAANAYIFRKNITLEARFDIISIIHNKDETRINHLKDAFYPRLRTG